MMNFYNFPKTAEESAQDYYARIRGIADFTGSPGYNTDMTYVWLEGTLIGETPLEGTELEELQARLFPEQQLSDEDKKMQGVEYNGKMCSATAEDQWGLASIKDDVLSGMDVNFHFENGTKLVLTADIWADFEAVWKPFRASFFPIG